MHPNSLLIDNLAFSSDFPKARNKHIFLKRWPMSWPWVCSGRLCDQAAAEQHPAAVPLGIWRAVQWIEENFATKVSIEKLAVQAGLSPRHFARSFLQATGYTPHAYLLRIRLGRARELNC